MQIVRTDRFVADVRSMIVVDLAGRNPHAAARYLDLVDHALRATARFPLARQEHPHLGPGVRKIQVGPYVILYCVRGQSMVALRFLHGRQNITRDLLT